MVLANCQGLQTTVAAQDRIPLLQAGPRTGSWESNDVSLEYQYVAQQGTFKLNIGGEAKRKYDQLSVWIKFFWTHRARFWIQKAFSIPGAARNYLEARVRLRKPSKCRQAARNSLFSRWGRSV
jgi:hypothetical protein